MQFSKKLCICYGSRSFLYVRFEFSGDTGSSTLRTSDPGWKGRMWPSPRQTHEKWSSCGTSCRSHKCLFHPGQQGLAKFTSVCSSERCNDGFHYSHFLVSWNLLGREISNTNCWIIHLCLLAPTSLEAVWLQNKFTQVKANNRYFNTVKKKTTTLF